MNDIKVGGTSLPLEVQIELSDLIARLSERYEFNNGSTAAFWAMALTLEQHIGEGLK